MRVIVVGAGVIGLACAVELQSAGFDVIVLEDGAPSIASDVAGGLWQPYATADDPRVLGWARDGYARLVADGHGVVDYLHLEREEPWWLAALPDGAVREAAPADLPAGYARGWVARVPLVEVPELLVELRTRVDVRTRRVTSLARLSGLVVNATGLAARSLAGDTTLVPVRGQVVWVEAPEGTPCVCDEDALTYVLPRRDVCVVGGTAEPGDEETATRPAQTLDILARATALVPALAGAPVVGAYASVRPVRPAGPRVEREGDVIHCYGHGGAGVTLAWGCAAEVVRLARD